MKQRPAKPVTISEELASRYTNDDQFTRFDSALMKVLSVSHVEILRREAEAKAKAALNANKRGPKPKNRLSSPGTGGSPLS